MNNLLESLYKLYTMEPVSYDCDQVIYWGWNRNSICKIDTSFQSLSLEEISFHRQIISAKKIKGEYIIVFFEGGIIRVFSFWGYSKFEHIGIVDLPPDIDSNVRQVFFLEKGEFKYDCSEESRFPEMSERPRLEFYNHEWTVIMVS